MPDATARLILGFDFGLRRIGIAAGDTLTRTAGARAVVTAGPAGPDWSAIEREIAQLGPDVLLVGRPLNADGTPGALTAASDRFAAQLMQRSGLPVLRADERWSSLEAAERLKGQRTTGLKRRRIQRGDIDSTSAVIILERWLAGEAYPP